MALSDGGEDRGGARGRGGAAAGAGAEEVLAALLVADGEQPRPEAAGGAAAEREMRAGG